MNDTPRSNRPSHLSRRHALFGGSALAAFSPFITRTLG